jgi:plasmid stabilization system protein ParE
MPAYSLSPDALEDLADIWDFVAFDNVNAANHLEDAFSTPLRSWPGGLGWGILAQM